jgi:hypothetical protein
VGENYIGISLAEEIDHHTTLGLVRKDVLVRDGRPE